MNGEPGAAVLSLFAQLIDRIKQRIPTRSDNRPVGTVVYSQLMLGMPIAKNDYFRPFSPAGGASLRDAVDNGETRPKEGASEAEIRDGQRAMEAAFKTSLLCRTMLQVTKDGLYHQYPTGRHIDSAYGAVVNGAQPGTQVELSPEIKARIAAANKVLYKLDADGNPIVKDLTTLYENYIANADALADAQANFATAFALHHRDPDKLAIWPIVSKKFSRVVDRAKDALISQGAAQVERALDTLASIGVPMQEHIVAKAKDDFERFNMGLSGVVPGDMPYSVILPSNWCDAGDHEGFETLIVDRAEVQHFGSAENIGATAQSWKQHSESNSGGGVATIGFCAFGASHEGGSMDSSFQNSNSSLFLGKFSNSAKNLHIELEYGLCSIVRPWLTSDLFFLRNWFVAGTKKNSISDGTIDGQADSMEKTLPMIPQQFLVIRNVVISASDWGSDSEVMSRFYTTNQGSIHEDHSETAAAAGVCLGFVNFGGRAGAKDANAEGQSSSFAAASSQFHFGTTFDGQTLRIPGAQIVAFLSDIVPASPDKDDPTL